MTGTNGPAGMRIEDLLAAARAPEVRARFSERQAAREAAEPEASGEGESRSLARLMDAGARPGAVVPIGMLRLYRELRAARSLAASPRARAARTSGTHRRDLDGTTVEFLPEDDAVYVVVTLSERMRAGRPPEAIELLGEDGALVRLPLPAPSDGIVQIAIPRDAPASADALRLMEDVGTSIFLV